MGVYCSRVGDSSRRRARPWSRSPFAYERHRRGNFLEDAGPAKKVDCLAARGVPARDEAFEAAVRTLSLCRSKGGTRVSMARILPYGPGAGLSPTLTVLG